MAKRFPKVPIDNYKFAECEDGQILLRIKGVIGVYCLSKDQAEAIHKDLELALYELQNQKNIHE